MGTKADLIERHQREKWNISRCPHLCPEGHVPTWMDGTLMVSGGDEEYQTLLIGRLTHSYKDRNCNDASVSPLYEWLWNVKPWLTDGRDIQIARVRMGQSPCCCITDLYSPEDSEERPFVLAQATDAVKPCLRRYSSTMKVDMVSCYLLFKLIFPLKVFFSLKKNRILFFVFALKRVFLPDDRLKKKKKKNVSKT